MDNSPKGGAPSGPAFKPDFPCQWNWHAVCLIAKAKIRVKKTKSKHQSKYENKTYTFLEFQRMHDD